MRELSFSTKWDKLRNDLIFTTFRFPRKDSDKGRDWNIEEVVKIVFKPRSQKERQVLGVARIIRKESKNLNNRWSYYPTPSFPNTPDMITPNEAYEDGFKGISGGGDTEKMRDYFLNTYGYSQCCEPINKLTLYWISKED